jgi:predicted DNA-binding ribbon-helix-helix protein
MPAKPVQNFINRAGRRTSIRLEPEFRDAIKHISKREKISIPEIIRLIDDRRKAGQSLTRAVRLFAVAYIRILADISLAQNANAPAAELLSEWQTHLSVHP